MGIKIERSLTLKPFLNKRKGLSVKPECFLDSQRSVTELYPLAEINSDKLPAGVYK